MFLKSFNRVCQKGQLDPLWPYFSCRPDIDSNDGSWGILDIVQVRGNTSHSYQHDDVIKWKHFPRSWPCVRGIHRSPVNFPHKGQWRGVLMFSLICTWINGLVNNGEAGNLRRDRAHYDVTVMIVFFFLFEL